MSVLGAVGAARRISDAIATLGWVVTDPIVASDDVDALTASITSHQGSAAARGGVGFAWATEVGSSSPGAGR